MLTELQNSINKINKKIKCLSCKIDSLSPGDGGGGGEGINIYNSDGTLTGNRTLLGNYTNLYFLELGTLKFSNYPLDYGYYQDPGTIKLGDYANNYITGMFFEIDASNKIIKSSNQNNDIGLKLDFANNLYQLGDLQTFNYLEVGPLNTQAIINGNSLLNVTSANYITIGDEQGNINYTTLWVDVNNEKIFTFYQGNDIGLKLDFANNTYWLGDHSATSIGNALWVSTFGIETQMTPVGNTQGFQFYNDPGMGIRWYKFGDIGNYDSGSSLEIDDWNGVTKTKYQGNDIGLKLDFGNTLYQFGEFNTSINYLSINSFNGVSELISSSKLATQVNDGINFVEFLIFSNSAISTYNSNTNGYNLDFANSNYQFGQLTGGNTTQLIINDAGEFAYFDNNNDGGNGLFLDYATKRFYFGEFAGGGNNTHIKIDDAAAYPVEIFGTNVSSGTAGVASGQFLKIKVGGVDYKIALLNP